MEPLTQIYEREMLYGVLKTIHLVGVVILVGNVTVTAFWKVFADRTAEPKIIAHAQCMVTITDWCFTAGGIVLIVAGGFGAAFSAGIHPFSTDWLVWGQLLLLLSGAIWLGILIPIQCRQARQARAFAVTGIIPESYWQDGRRWLIWGIIATVPLVAAIYVMLVKP